MLEKVTSCRNTGMRTTQQQQQHGLKRNNNHLPRQSNNGLQITRLNLGASELIETCVKIDTFAPQFLWLLMIGAPESSLTKRIMGDTIVPILLLSTIHLLIVTVAASQEGAIAQIGLFQDVFDPAKSQLSGMQKLFDIPNFVAEEWPHVLIWDLFVGRYIWKDGLQRDIDTRFSLAFCNFIGPPGLLIYAATCIITKKGLPKM